MRNGFRFVRNYVGEVEIGLDLFGKIVRGERFRTSERNSGLEQDIAAPGVWFASFLICSGCLGRLMTVPVF